ncbi:MAG: DUF1592 domain-containing protein [Myxococcota bacterium]
MAMRFQWLKWACASVLLAGCYEGIQDGAGASGLSGGGLDDGGSSDGSEDTDGDDGGMVPGDYEPAPVSLRRLLASQYVESIRLLLGDAAAAVANPPDDAALNGFTAIGASQLALGSAEVDRYETSARDIAAAAVAEGTVVGAYVTCTPTAPTDDACMRTFIGNFGRFAFRHTLEPDELSRYTNVALTAAGDQQDFYAGVEAGIAAMLQSPLFLYQVETGEPDPDTPSQRRLVGTELATRVSFFLTGATPDVTMLDAAENGFLDEPGGVRAAAEALLERNEARIALRGFSDELLRLRDLDGLPKDAATFPTYDTELAAAMREETRRLIEHVAFDLDGDFSEVFDANYTFVNDVLAAHYGIPGEFGSEFVQVTLPAEQRRGGILGHAGMLSVLAHVSSTSPTLRGKYIRETLMCQTIPAPPPGVVTDLPVGDGTETMRERLQIHMTDPSCSGCHLLMDPIGFALESYDGVGAYRTLDNGKPIDDSADLDGVPVAGALELGAALRDSNAAHACLIRNLYRHATGHVETESELDALASVSDAYAASGHNLKAALIEIAASPAFRVVGEPL